jgi:hypothetical protein
MLAATTEAEAEPLEDEEEESEEFPFEADIIHDEKDLVDVLAAAEQEIIASNSNQNQNGIGGHEEGPDSPPPVPRSLSSPRYTYSSRRSPSPPNDIHGEDQEIIDSFSEPQDENENESESDEKPELLSDHTYVVGNNRGIDSKEKPPPTNLEELSIEIPTEPEPEEKKPTRSTRSNTRIVSPDITAFTPSRSDTPKPLQAPTKKAEPGGGGSLMRNSPKPSPTGSLKLLSPSVSGSGGHQSSSSARSSPIPNSGLVLNSTGLGSHSHSTNASNSKSRGGGGLVNKRKRQESDSSSTSKEEEPKVELIDLNSRPGKRRCSENAAELIKACIGIEDTPKRNTLLIKRLEEANKLKEAKNKKAMRKYPKL